jgi:hypothetical protein
LAKTGSKEFTKDDQFLFRWNGRQVLTSIVEPYVADQRAKSSGKYGAVSLKINQFFKKQ